ncbi:MAG: hypothetical protein ACTS6P_01705 [Candidatus Hodgkinia cicadicola]
MITLSALARRAIQHPLNDQRSKGKLRNLFNKIASYELIVGWSDTFNMKSSSALVKPCISAKATDHQYLLNYETACSALMNSILLTKTITRLLQPRFVNKRHVARPSEG